MEETVEIGSLDVRYEGCRMRNRAAEKALLLSIMENGIREPLEGVEERDWRVLLNGFKRYRCARRLGIGMVPYRSLGRNAAQGIIHLIRMGNAKSLSMIEQAKLIDELKTGHGMSTKEIARELDKSRAWVSVRTGIVEEISEAVMAQLLRGAFPVYSYMYTVRPFIRINGVKKIEVEKFVLSVAGKAVSIRDIDLLAHGYFKGPAVLRRQIEEGHLGWGLKRLKETSWNGKGFTEREQEMLRSLEQCQKYMDRLICGSEDGRLPSNGFRAQANLLAGGIMEKLDVFGKAMRQLYDRTG